MNIQLVTYWPLIFQFQIFVRGLGHFIYSIYSSLYISVCSQVETRTAEQKTSKVKQWSQNSLFLSQNANTSWNFKHMPYFERSSYHIKPF